MSTTPTLEELRVRANAHLDDYANKVQQAACYTGVVEKITQNIAAEMATASPSEREALAFAIGVLKGSVDGRNQALMATLGCHTFAVVCFKKAGGVAEILKRIPEPSAVSSSSAVPSAPSPDAVPTSSPPAVSSSARPVESRFNPVKMERTPIGNEKST